MNYHYKIFFCSFKRFNRFLNFGLIAIGITGHKYWFHADNPINEAQLRIPVIEVVHTIGSYQFTLTVFDDTLTALRGAKDL